MYTTKQKLRAALYTLLVLVAMVILIAITAIWPMETFLTVCFIITLAFLCFLIDQTYHSFLDND